MTSPVVAAKQPMPITVEAGKDYWWCACGQSKKQPFCDGSHKGTEFAPMKWTAETDGRKFFCTCKHSANKPFCDGTHSKL